MNLCTLTLGLFGHKWTKTVVLPGCRERVDCEACGVDGVVRIAHSFSPWSLFQREAAVINRYGMRVLGSEHIATCQRRVCVRCNWAEERIVP